ncbi:MAG: phosphate ABC transporter permease PstA [Thermanaerothrix sp.]|uniref:Phosphate transport system permease protein PstA n=1 Tax=Thermanaerothrix solaris TaxID=3058434 RepID=A0ABU3NM93_9CHLR|nr:phosphate ABC transporter permease PstA [Thermanaerothrix sp. 4228-RoL]MDT8897952.1 phosphate ABC transporter permease PstA [Thermanaerothrix sp. 4228-RoL]
MNTTAFLSAEELQRLQQRKQRGRYFEWLALMAVLIGIVVLLTLLIDVFLDGLPWLRPELFTHFPSRFPEKSGLRSALQGTLWLAVITAILSFPIGVAAAIYLEEYARDNWFTRFIEINISNLAGVPSIIYGLLGLGLFVYGLNLGRSLLAGALTMTLLVLPTVIVSSREAIRAVPRSVRLAAFGLGATPWQTVRDHVLPYAMPGILTGTILAMSRAIGETAPLITIGALTYIRFDLRGPLDLFTVLPIQIFNWISLPQKEFQQLAAAGIIVLLAVLLLLNTTAIILRIRLQKRW